MPETNARYATGKRKTAIARVWLSPGDGSIIVNGKPVVNRPATLGDIQATSAESDALSKDLRKRGFKFVGSTIIYAYMQGIGMVDDHDPHCFCRQGRR